MAGHTITPYSVVATRRHARKDKDKRLLLASLSTEATVDLLDVVEQHVASVEPVVSGDRSVTVSCVKAQRQGDGVIMVISIETTGEQEIIRDGDRRVVLVKSQEHATQYYSCALLWRPPDGDEGVLLTHSPWGRGGRRTEIVRLMQRAANTDPLAKAKIATDPLVPPRVLEQYLRNANATRIVYSKTSGVRSTFDDVEKSTPVELDLVVRGSDSLPFRDALSSVLKKRRSQGLEGLFTVRVRDDSQEEGYRDEVFDDVAIDIPTPGGMRRYSLKNDTIPTLGYDATEDITSAYHGLASVDEGQWPERLMAAVRPKLEKLRREITL